MIDLWYWTTPNGHKITIFLEETGLPYKITPVNIGKGEQFKADFLAISPNNRIPALVDDDPPGGGAPISVFESGAMLVYLAEKIGKFLPKEPRKRADVMQWLFWQMGGLGPMSGQNNHFSNYALDKISYAMDRYRNEVNRLYGVMDRRLAGRPFLAGDYSIADMASYPWAVLHERQHQKIADFPNLKRWLETIAARPAVVKAYEWTPKINPGQGGIRTPEERAILFGQTAESIAKAAAAARCRSAMEMDVDLTDRRRRIRRSSNRPHP
jgi:GSH-dependent disulfide-bond oxidoreductase